MGWLSRRDFLRAAAWSSGVAVAGTLRGQTRSGEQGDRAPAVITPKISRSIRAGLDYLVSRQTDDGAFGNRGYRRNVAVVSLGGMAFLAHGSTPSRGEYGEAIDGATRYVLAHSQDNGFIIAEESQSHGPMYGHGFSTLFLAEVYGMWPESDIRDKLAAAVRLIVQTQNPAGGWRYHPEPTEADISVTICQIMALRAARNAGIYVPNETIERCLQYVKSCQNPDGGFGYTPQSRQSLYPRSAAGVVALYSAGIYESEEVQKALAYLDPFTGQLPQMRNDANFLYGQYYAAQAMWHAGGERFRRWYTAAAKTLLDTQRPDGSWDDEICPEYGTAMACLVLQTPSNYLPIFQR